MPIPALSDEEAFRGFVKRKGHVNEATLDRYWQYVVAFLTWLDGEPITPQSVDAYYQQIICRKYRVNSRLVVCPALTWYLRSKKIRDEEDEPLRFPMPSKELLEDRYLIDEEADWLPLKRELERQGNLKELALVLLQHDSLLRPSDLVNVRLSQVRLDVDHPCIDGKVQQKTNRRVKPFITKETARTLGRYIERHKPSVYLFEVMPGRPHHRRYPLEVIRRACGRAGLPDTITPRAFRRTGATMWKGDVKDLQAQGGWADPKTIYQHYRQWQDERHWEAFEKTFEPPKKEETETDDSAYIR
jgi:integrase